MQGRDTDMGSCSFRKEDYVTEPDIDADYDCILCLSVTKWVHFNLVHPLCFLSGPKT